MSVPIFFNMKVCVCVLIRLASLNSDLTSHKQRGQTEEGPRFKVSPEGPEKRGIDLAISGLVVYHVIHYKTAALPVGHEYPRPAPFLNNKHLFSKISSCDLDIVT